MTREQFDKAYAITEQIDNIETALEEMRNSDLVVNGFRIDNEILKRKTIAMFHEMLDVLKHDFANL